MRRLVALLTLTGLLLSGVPALETPLVLQAQNSRLTGVVNPSQGSIQIYEISGERLTLRGTANFLADLEFQRDIPPDAEHLDWSSLRAGSTSTLPTYGQMFDDIFTQLDKNRSRRAEGPTFRERAWATEEAFWAQLPAYDGKILAALAGGGGAGTGCVAIVVPCYYSVIFYFIDGFNITYAGHRNYRPDLMIPQVLRSIPSPRELLDALPADIQADQREALEKRMEALIEAEGAAGQAMLPVAPSDPWITTVNRNNQDLFLIFDPPNNRILSYLYRADGKGGKLELKSVRNIEVDLMIPSTFKSDPPVANLVKEHNRWREKQGLPPVNEQYLRMYADRRAVNAQGASELQANEDGEGRIVIDFPMKRKILVYDPFGPGDQLELESMRDYTLEAAITLDKKDIAFKSLGLQLLERASGFSKADRREKETEQILSLVEKALAWNPHAYSEAEKDRQIKKLSEHPRFQPMIDKAVAEATRLDEEFEQLMKAAIEEEERRAQLRRDARGR